MAASATHPKLDFGPTFVHEGLELEKKIFVTISTRRKSGVMDAEASWAG